MSHVYDTLPEDVRELLTQCTSARDNHPLFVWIMSGGIAARETPLTTVQLKFLADKVKDLFEDQVRPRLQQSRMGRYAKVPELIKLIARAKACGISPSSAFGIDAAEEAHLHYVSRVLDLNYSVKAAGYPSGPERQAAHRRLALNLLGELDGSPLEVWEYHDGSPDQVMRYARYGMQCEMVAIVEACKKGDLSGLPRLIHVHRVLEYDWVALHTDTNQVARWQREAATAGIVIVLQKLLHGNVDSELFKLEVPNMLRAMIAHEVTLQEAGVTIDQFAAVRAEFDSWLEAATLKPCDYATTSATVRAAAEVLPLFDQVIELSDA